MAQLKNTIVLGDLRVTDALQAQTTHTDKLYVYTTTMVSQAAQYPGDWSLYNSSGTKVGEYWYNTGDNVNVTTGQYKWRQFSPKEPADTTVTAFSETYSLPEVTKGRTSSDNYTILTTKEAVTVAQGGTGKQSWTSWGILYASGSTTLAQVAAGASSNYNNKYQVLTSNGAAAPVWKTALLMAADVPILNTDDLNTVPVGVTRFANATAARNGTNVPTTACGGKVYTFGGYTGNDNTYKVQLYVGNTFHTTFIRRQTDDTTAWTDWYRIPIITKDSSASIGSTTQPVYVNQYGQILAGTALKALAYKDSITLSDISDISNLTLTGFDIVSDTTGTLTVARGGTGVTSFTNDGIIVATGTTQTLVSRGLKVTGSTSDSVTLTTVTANKNITVDTGTGTTTIKGATIELRANTFRLRNNESSATSAVTDKAYVTSLKLGDNDEVTLNEYGDGKLAIHSNYSIILHSNSSSIPVYSPTSSYSVGTIVWYNRAYYVCKTAISSSGETWTSSHWTSVSTTAGNILSWGNISPIKDNTWSLGTSTYKWSTVYADALSTTTINGLILPTSAGNSGEYLKSNGSNAAPTWTTIVTTDEKVGVKTSNSTQCYLLCTTTTPSGTQQNVTAVAKSSIYINANNGTLYADYFVGNGNGLTGLNYLPVNNIPSGDEVEDYVYTEYNQNSHSLTFYFVQV